MSEPGTWNIAEIPEGDDSDIEEIADSILGSQVDLDSDEGTFTINFFGLD